ncbi:uncharacterized protein LOC124648756 [Lolium rigidum]|uniref:uncharacterized protein LOC124648756 n=1 Tax=Lolium rigidum TaxID=89674 RepID=UPI001F5D4347|nr:uncharacterized protein LOC124648756 [Lolium rigidum]
MDQFPDGYPVRLRSAVHGTYLRADKDGDGVSLGHRRASMKVAWFVHRYYGDYQHVLLHSAAYGRYLYATDAPAPLGCLGFRVAQRSYDGLEDEAIRWQPVRVGSRGEILLRRHVAQGGPDSYGYLRGNGKYLIWNDSVVSVHDVDKLSTMMRWVVEPVPITDRIPRLPRPTRLHLSVLQHSRVVMFTGNGEGLYANDISFTFRGRSVHRLRNELVSRLGIPGNVSNDLVMYVRAGTYGRNTPLGVNLSRSRETLVITPEPANGGLRYPDFDAE